MASTLALSNPHMLYKDLYPRYCNEFSNQLFELISCDFEFSFFKLIDGVKDFYIEYL